MSKDKKNKRTVIDGDRTLDKQIKQMREVVAASNTPDDIVVLPSGDLGQVISAYDEWGYRTHGKAGLNATICQWADFFKTVRGRSERFTSLPVDLVNAYLDLGVWPGIPRVTRLAKAPVISPDWSITWDAGYVDASQAWVTASLDAPEWATRPITQAEVVAARDRLLGWFDQFKLSYAEHRADALALALTPLIMHAMPDATIPGGLAKAANEGSGKTQLMQLIGFMGTGVQPDPTSFAGEAETKKMITSALKEASPVYLFDNIRANIKSDALEAALTGRWWKDRKMGVQENLRVRNDTMWLLTANGANASKDMLRRLVIIDLDTEVASRAAWDGTVLIAAKVQQAQIRTDLALLVAWWVQNGAQPGQPRSLSHPQWSSVLDGILHWAGVPGFLTAADTARSTVATSDDEDEVVLDLIYKAMGDEPFTPTEFVEKIVDPLDLTGRFAALRDWAGHRLGTGGRAASTAAGSKLAGLVGKNVVGSPWRLTKSSRTYQVAAKVAAVAR